MKFELKDFEVEASSDLNIYDVLSFINCWGKNLNKKSYTKIENKILSREKIWSFAKVYFWCDISGWNYWFNDESQNYIVCTIEILKPLTKRRLISIEKYINKSKEYFNDFIFGEEEKPF